MTSPPPPPQSEPPGVVVTAPSPVDEPPTVPTPAAEPRTTVEPGPTTTEPSVPPNPPAPVVPPSAPAPVVPPPASAPVVPPPAPALDLEPPIVKNRIGHNLEGVPGRYVETAPAVPGGEPITRFVTPIHDFLATGPTPDNKGIITLPLSTDILKIKNMASEYRSFPFVPFRNIHGPIRGYRLPYRIPRAHVGPPSVVRRPADASGDEAGGNPAGQHGPSPDDAQPSPQNQAGEPDAVRSDATQTDGRQPTTVRSDPGRTEAPPSEDVQSDVERPQPPLTEGSVRFGSVSVRTFERTPRQTKVELQIFKVQPADQTSTILHYDWESAITVAETEIDMPRKFKDFEEAIIGWLRDGISASSGTYFFFTEHQGRPSYFDSTNYRALPRRAVVKLTLGMFGMYPAELHVWEAGQFRLEPANALLFPEPVRPAFENDLPTPSILLPFGDVSGRDASWSDIRRSRSVSPSYAHTGRTFPTDRKVRLNVNQELDWTYGVKRYDPRGMRSGRRMLCTHKRYHPYAGTTRERSTSEEPWTREQHRAVYWLDHKRREPSPVEMDYDQNTRPGHEWPRLPEHGLPTPEPMPDDKWLEDGRERRIILMQMHGLEAVMWEPLSWEEAQWRCHRRWLWPKVPHCFDGLNFAIAVDGQFRILAWDDFGNLPPGQFAMYAFIRSRDDLYDVPEDVDLDWVDPWVGEAETMNWAIHDDDKPPLSMELRLKARAWLIEQAIAEHEAKLQAAMPEIPFEPEVALAGGEQTRKDGDPAEAGAAAEPEGPTHPVAPKPAAVGPAAAEPPTAAPPAPLAAQPPNYAAQEGAMPQAGDAGPQQGPTSRPAPIVDRDVTPAQPPTDLDGEPIHCPSPAPIAAPCPTGALDATSRASDDDSILTPMTETRVEENRRKFPYPTYKPERILGWVAGVSLDKVLSGSKDLRWTRSGAVDVTAPEAVEDADDASGPFVVEIVPDGTSGLGGASPGQGAAITVQQPRPGPLGSPTLRMEVDGREHTDAQAAVVSSKTQGKRKAHSTSGVSSPDVDAPAAKRVRAGSEPAPHSDPAVAPQDPSSAQPGRCSAPNDAVPDALGARTPAVRVEDPLVPTKDMAAMQTSEDDRAIWRRHPGLKIKTLPGHTMLETLEAMRGVGAFASPLKPAREPVNGTATEPADQPHAPDTAPAKRPKERIRVLGEYFTPESSTVSSDHQSARMEREARHMQIALQWHVRKMQAEMEARRRDDDDDDDDDATYPGPPTGTRRIHPPMSAVPEGGPVNVRPLAQSNAVQLPVNRRICMERPERRLPTVIEAASGDVDAGEAESVNTDANDWSNNDDPGDFDLDPEDLKITGVLREPESQRMLEYMEESAAGHWWTGFVTPLVPLGYSVFRRKRSDDEAPMWVHTSGSDIWPKAFMPWPAPLRSAEPRTRRCRWANLQNFFLDECPDAARHPDLSEGDGRDLSLFGIFELRDGDSMHDVIKNKGLNAMRSQWCDSCCKIRFGDKTPHETPFSEPFLASVAINGRFLSLVGDAMATERLGYEDIDFQIFVRPSWDVPNGQIAVPCGYMVAENPYRYVSHGDITFSPSAPNHVFMPKLWDIPDPTPGPVVWPVETPKRAVPTRRRPGQADHARTFLERLGVLDALDDDSDPSVGSSDDKSDDGKPDDIGGPVQPSAPAATTVATEDQEFGENDGEEEDEVEALAPEAELEFAAVDMTPAVNDAPTSVSPASVVPASVVPASVVPADVTPFSIPSTSYTLPPTSWRWLLPPSWEDERGELPIASGSGEQKGTPTPEPSVGLRTPAPEPNPEEEAVPIPGPSVGPVAESPSWVGQQPAAGSAQRPVAYQNDSVPAESPAIQVHIVAEPRLESTQTALVEAADTSGASREILEEGEEGKRVKQERIDEVQSDEAALVQGGNGGGATAEQGDVILVEDEGALVDGGTEERNDGGIDIDFMMFDSLGI